MSVAIVFSQAQRSDVAGSVGRSTNNGDGQQASTNEEATSGPRAVAGHQLLSTS